MPVIEKWKQDFQKKVECYCPCHIDTDNVFSFREGIHCDKCYPDNKEVKPSLHELLSRQIFLWRNDNSITSEEIAEKIIKIIRDYHLE